MAFTGYLKIEGIDGESKRADHEGEIDCFGVEFERQPDPAARPSARAAPAAAPR